MGGELGRQRKDKIDPTPTPPLDGRGVGGMGRRRGFGIPSPAEGRVILSNSFRGKRTWLREVRSAPLII